MKRLACARFSGYLSSKRKTNARYQATRWCRSAGPGHIAASVPAARRGLRLLHRGASGRAPVGLEGGVLTLDVLSTRRCGPCQRTQPGPRLRTWRGRGRACVPSRRVAERCRSR
jgi:hypothetical protein